MIDRFHDQVMFPACNDQPQTVGYFDVGQGAPPHYAAPPRRRFTDARTSWSASQSRSTCYQHAPSSLREWGVGMGTGCQEQLLR
jgi:hypothetical protein